ncbi:MAG: hypothetical protein JW830_14200 [Bacteroidales bacterium]|nr:hypothetical protein [Bacteroidales bacterium]
MNHEIEANLLHASDEAIKIRLGISGFHNSVLSYGKILYNHSILSYDNESIYFIDKLHVTYSFSKKIEKSIAEAFYKRKQYDCDNHLILIPNYKHGNNYHYSFAIEFDGKHFGYLHLCNTKKTNICKIETDNRTLYESSIMYILARLYHIAWSFDLQYNNINTFEIARDTTKQLYSQMSEIYYQSTIRNENIQMIFNKEPKYKPITRTKIHDYPADNGNGGTFIIGANSSESLIRIYSKTPEIVDNSNKKEYIHELHVKQFGLLQNINRAEAVIFGNAFRTGGILGSYGYNLLEVLIPQNLPSIYFKVLGDKLTFNNLTTKTWNKANNEKYERVRLIPELDSKNIQQKKLILQPIVTRFSHCNHINKHKFKLIEYLDGDIPYSELKRYFTAKRGKNEINVDDVSKAYRIIQRNYCGTIDHDQNKRIGRLLLSLESRSRIPHWWATVCYVFSKITMKQ